MRRPEDRTELFVASELKVEDPGVIYNIQLIIFNLLGLSIGCFKCHSINGENPACEDPFHNNVSGRFYFYFSPVDVLRRHFVENWRHKIIKRKNGKQK
jgi:hypothetical protein